VQSIHRLPSVFSNYFELNKNVHSHNTRRSKDLYVTAINKKFGKRCIKHKATTLWNQLPEVLKDRLSVRNCTGRLSLSAVNEHILVRKTYCHLTHILLLFNHNFCDR